MELSTLCLVSNVAMKLLNYGQEENNCVIRPAQQADGEVDVLGRRSTSILSRVYARIKGLKSMLNVDVSSYSAKKVVLLDEVIPY